MTFEDQIPKDLKILFLIIIFVNLFYRFGNLHILFGLFLIALGICQILFAIQDDIHIAFRVTPVWVGTLVSLVT